MKIINFFNKIKSFKMFLKKENKDSKHNKEILSLYESGKILQVDKDIDNKEYLKSEDN